VCTKLSKITHEFLLTANHVLTLQKVMKYAKNLLGISACGDYCCVSSRIDEEVGQVVEFPQRLVYKY